LKHTPHSLCIFLSPRDCLKSRSRATLRKNVLGTLTPKCTGTRAATYRAGRAPAVAGDFKIPGRAGILRTGSPTRGGEHRKNKATIPHGSPASGPFATGSRASFPPAGVLFSSSFISLLYCVIFERREAGQRWRGTPPLYTKVALLHCRLPKWTRPLCIRYGTKR